VLQEGAFVVMIMMRQTDRLVENEIVTVSSCIHIRVGIADSGRALGICGVWNTIGQDENVFYDFMAGMLSF
jgi:hypothetical protein